MAKFKNFDLYDSVDFARLDTVYNQMRVLQAKSNGSEYGCIGSGKCCKIGLTIPMIECAYIAFNTIREYYLIMEGQGEEVANAWMDDTKAMLKQKLFDRSWEVSGATNQHCVWFDKKVGCTIYDYRPFICRAYGVIETVDDFCPRKRMPDGSVSVIRGGSVKKLVEDFRKVIDEWEERRDEHMTVYMPLGVLNFIATAEELHDLRKATDPKFWYVADRYRMHFFREILGEEATQE